jgi:DNA processing protein
MYLHWIWYAQLPGLSLRRKAQLLQYFSSPEDIFHAPKSNLEQTGFLQKEELEALANKTLTGAKQIEQACEDLGVFVLPYGLPQYPAKLRNIPDAPMVLYCLGKMPDLQIQPAVGVVGTRKATGYGISTAQVLAAQITSCGGLVVSGAAAGIDAAAMNGAMDASGSCIGVLGCGVDVVYPKSNRELYNRTAKVGCLISEYPPGTKPSPWNFPQRNRIISGISNAVLVIEAPLSSGALITAKQALEQGKDVFCVPGNIDNENCAGSNALLRDGAAIACSGWDILQNYQHYDGVALREPVLPAKKNIEPQQEEADKISVDNMQTTPYSVQHEVISGLSEQEKAIFQCLTPQPRPIDEVIAQIGESSGKVLSILTRLSLQGLVQLHPGRLVSAKTQKH